MCNHNVYFKRTRRTLWHKLLGIKELYICSKCKHVIKIK